MKPTSKQHPIRLPGPIKYREIGLGDMIAHAASRMGIKPCEKCKKRASILNKVITFGRAST